MRAKKDGGVNHDMTDITAYHELTAMNIYDSKEIHHLQVPCYERLHLITPPPFAIISNYSTVYSLLLLMVIGSEFRITYCATFLGYWKCIWLESWTTLRILKWFGSYWQTACRLDSKWSMVSSALDFNKTLLVYVRFQSTNDCIQTVCRLDFQISRTREFLTCIVQIVRKAFQRKQNIEESRLIIKFLSSKGAWVYLKIIWPWRTMR